MPTLALLFAQVASAAFDARGGQFLGFKRFSDFEKSPGTRARETVLTSPIIGAQIRWDQLVVSWNAEVPDGAYLKLEARAIYPTRSTKFYVMGLWSSNPTRHPRESVLNQKDDDGDVATDTLILKRSADRLQIRITLGTDEPEQPKLKFLGLALTDSKADLRPLPANRLAWGRVLPVPQRTQMAYPNGNVLCSPTTVSMILSYWAKTLNRPELDHDVPEITKAIYDAKWRGTGNWPFNTAYAGSFPGIRGYVVRLSDLAEVEEWIAAGVPVGLSICSNRLHRRGRGPSGHLIVCVGFTENGDPIVNDPGSSKNVRRVYPRQDLIYAWAYSRNAAYLIYPENSEIPRDRFGHWDSWTARQRVNLEGWVVP